jgi:hypothetical protein
MVTPGLLAERNDFTAPARKRDLSIIVMHAGPRLIVNHACHLNHDKMIRANASG